MRKVSSELCARCKGYKRLCGLPSCPILQRLRAYKSAGWDRREPEGPSPPSPLVGERGYPKIPVSLGISPYGDPKLRDDPIAWVNMKMRLEDIAKLRMEMLNPFTRVDARKPWLLNKGEIIWGAVSEKPVDVEAKLIGRPSSPSLDGILAPIGPSAKAEEVKVTTNPKVDPVLERRAQERLKAEEAMKELYERINFYTLIKAFSLGMFGVNKKLVPTRWAITASDQIASKYLKEEIVKMTWIKGIMIGKHTHLGNSYTVILKPGPPTVEMFEVWHKGSLWTGSSEVVIHNIEEHLPTAKASDPTDGGFHALKHGVLKALKEKGVSASAIVIREIGETYYMPLGVWQVREGARIATENALRSSIYSEREVAEVLRGSAAEYLHRSLLWRRRSLFGYIR